jgi:hypothetical protein
VFLIALNFIYFLFVFFDAKTRVNRQSVVAGCCPCSTVKMMESKQIKCFYLAYVMVRAEN